MFNYSKSFIQMASRHCLPSSLSWSQALLLFEGWRQGGLALRLSFLEKSMRQVLPFQYFQHWQLVDSGKERVGWWYWLPNFQSCFPENELNRAKSHQNCRIPKSLSSLLLASEERLAVLDVEKSTGMLRIQMYYLRHHSRLLGWDLENLLLFLPLHFWAVEQGFQHFAGQTHQENGCIPSWLGWNHLPEGSASTGCCQYFLDWR